jgi:hypothetical protein
MAGTSSQSSYCEGTTFSVRITSDQLVPSMVNSGVYTPNCASFFVYNNTDCVVTFEDIPYQPQGTACYDEMISGCYDQPVAIKFDQSYTTGAFIVQKKIKMIRK